ncbi:MAG: hypothetical protein WC536_00970 [Patescibacteria group bacterium]
MKTKVLVFGNSEEYADQVSRLLEGVTFRRVYFMDEAMKAAKRDIPDIIILHLRYEVKAIFQLRKNGFKGLIITEGPYNYLSEIAGFDIRTDNVEGTAKVTLEISNKIQPLLNRPNKGRRTLIKDLDHYVGMGLTRIETLIFLNSPVPHLAMKIAKAKVCR